MSSLTNSQINSKSMNGLINVEANSGTFDNLTVNSLNVIVSGTAPTPPLLDNSTNIATTAFVLSHASGNYVDLTTNQTIVSGIKTFNTLPKSSAVPTLGDELVNKNFTDATYVDLVNNQTIVSGIKTFNTLPQSSVVPTLGDEFVNKNFTDATYVDLVNNETIGGIKTFTSLPECSTSATTGNQLVNLNTLNSTISAGSFVTTNTTQTISGAKTITTNTLKAEAGVTIKNGTGAQNATLTHDTTTLDIIGSGDISIKPTNDFNVVTGTGKDITLSNPDSATINTTATINTGFINSSSAIVLASPTTYILGLSTQPSLILSGGFGTIYGFKFTRGGTALSAINRINCSSTNDTLYLEVNSGTQLTITNSTVSISKDFILNQSTYPSTNTLQLGYTIQKTFATTVLGDTPGTFTLVGSGQALGTDKGVYLITCGFELTNSGSDTVTNKALCLSLSSASGTPVNAYGAWEYYEEINDSMGSAGTRYIGTLTGVYTKTTASAQTLYLNGYANTSGSQTISATGNCSITRIG